MRTLLVLLLSLALLAPGDAAGQNAIWAGAGLQVSRMDDLKYLQGLILETYPIPGKVTSSFPPFTMLSLGYINQWYPTIRIGAGYSFSTTGGKSNYSDYSGYVTSTINAVSHRVGGFVSHSVLDADWFELSVFGRVRINYTIIDIKTSISALGASSYNKNSYSSLSPGGSAGLEFLFHFNEISFGAEGGYEADIPGKLTNRESDNDLSDPNDRERILTSDWTGWFAQLKFLFWLGI
ncbi:MAG: hypothetical protein GY790_21130 [Bacteroidetes bacterium]|nr:hypothetical protein [Bacteroidota bacterium]